jgi:hypothetical protein
MLKIHLKTAIKARPISTETEKKEACPHKMNMPHLQQSAIPEIRITGDQQMIRSQP